MNGIIRPRQGRINQKPGRIRGLIHTSLIPALQLSAFLVIRGGQAHGLFEQAGEIVHVREADLRGDLIEGIVAAEQELLGLFNAPSIDVLDGGHAHESGKAVGEVVRIEANEPGQFLQCDGCIEIVMDVDKDFSKAAETVQCVGCLGVVLDSIIGYL